MTFLSLWRFHRSCAKAARSIAAISKTGFLAQAREAGIEVPDGGAGRGLALRNSPRVLGVRRKHIRQSIVSRKWRARFTPLVRTFLHWAADYSAIDIVRLWVERLELNEG
jgi:hypothetical protein